MIDLIRYMFDYITIYSILTKTGFLLFHFSPLIAAFILVFFPSHKFDLIRWFSIFYSVGIFFFSILFGFMLNYFNTVYSLYFADEFYVVHYKYFVIDNLNISYTLGYDGLSYVLIVLTSIIFTSSIYISFDNIRIYQKYFYILLFFTQFLVFGCFLTTNLFFFYLYFESLLIPMFILIGLWGSRDRKIHASYQFFFYTLFSSLFLLLALIHILKTVGTLDYYMLFHYNQFPLGEQKLLWLAFFFAFAVKMPIFPFHVWLPEAHSEAPTAGSMILAGVLLKIGAYGILRFLLTFLNEASHFFVPFVYTLGIIGIFYASFCAIRQTDLKRIVAYSSVVHMNFMLLGLFSFSREGLIAACMMLVSHGIISAGLFAFVGMIYDRFGTRNIQELGGLASKLPKLYFFGTVLFLGNISFPGTISFIPEVLTFIGIYKISSLALVLASFGMIFNTAFNALFLTRIFFGPRRDTTVIKEVMPLTLFENDICNYYIMLIFWLGARPDHLAMWFDTQSNFINFILSR